MADVKISALPAAASALATDEYPVNQSGTTKKVTGTQISTLISSLNAPTISGSRGVPTNITAVGGITPPGGYKQIMYIQGSAGSVDITANPQIVAGTADGQELELRGRNDSQRVLIEDGTGLSLNGQFDMGADDSITLKWDTSAWVEVARRENV